VTYIFFPILDEQHIQFFLSNSIFYQIQRLILMFGSKWWILKNRR